MCTSSAMSAPPGVTAVQKDTDAPQRGWSDDLSRSKLSGEKNRFERSTERKHVLLDHPRHGPQTLVWLRFDDASFRDLCAALRYELRPVC